jgi:hypothetical protein
MVYYGSKAASQEVFKRVKYKKRHPHPSKNGNYGIKAIVDSAITCSCYVIPGHIGYGLSGMGPILNGDLKDNRSATGQLAGVQTLEVGHPFFGP